MYFNMENISEQGFQKIQETSIFEPFLNVSTRNEMVVTDSIKNRFER